MLIVKTPLKMVILEKSISIFNVDHHKMLTLFNKNLMEDKLQNVTCISLSSLQSDALIVIKFKLAGGFFSSIWTLIKYCFYACIIYFAIRIFINIKYNN